MFAGTISGRAGTRHWGRAASPGLFAAKEKSFEIR